ncbi:alpha/beta hydrolase family protein [Streptomyces sp. AN091965]|uniref:alpha/beta hydrolase family protein n=1 Tax=Streptomyces sp. AN091965 TaxID=2927803 RepID=UPI001F613D9D|nr:alpha/beta hydrolase [Streptomyces sp. AN091965]MCI3934304.1 alpha/beta hydrolase [Streptomyces sp. AN091965]
MRRTFLAACAALAAALTVSVPTAAARAEAPSPPARAAAPELPEPTGKQAVGMAVVHLKDADRADPWVPGQRRELMVSVWYPAAKPSGTRAPYMTADESRTYLEANAEGLPPEVPKDVLSTVVTHATVRAAPVRARGGLPLVVLSPGFGMPRATLTGLAEELASRGYAVAAIGHNYEADGISFPDGPPTTCVACAHRDYPKVGAVRAADVSFVLDELTGERPAWRGGPRLDPGRVAMAGHSAGGFSTVPALLRDARVRAAVNMDGNFHFPNDTPLDRPLLMLGKPSHVPGGPDRTWDETWAELTGWKRWLTVDDTEHTSFTDLAPLGKRLGLPQQRLDGDRADALTRAYVTAFVDTHLRGRNAPLLTGPSARFPEVRFHRP